MSFALPQWTIGFDLLLRTTLQASILILLILALRLLLARRLQGRWLFALWFVLLVRLAMPWTPASPVSLYGILPGFTQPVSQSTAGASQAPAGLLSPASLDHAASGASAGSSPAVAGTEPRALAGWTSLNIRHAFYVIWLAGILVLGTILLAVNFAFLRKVRREPLIIDETILRLFEDCKAQMGVRTVVGLVSSDRVRSPALYGFVRPRLLLPRNLLQMLDRTELRHIFLHELAHLKRHDILVGWLASCLQVLHWPNPLVWLGLHRMRLDRELACDGLAMTALAPDTPRDYGRTILHVLECFRDRQYMPALAGLVDNPSQLQRRITMIAQPHRTSQGSALLGVSLLIALALVTLTDSPGVAAQANSNGSAAPQTAAPVASQPAGDSDEVALPEGSYLDKHGHIVDKIDRPFVDDPQVLGKWESVDFVRTIEQFDPKTPQTKPQDLFLKGLIFSKGGRANWPWRGWTKGFLMHDGDMTAMAYVIQEINGANYLFLEWKSGDYSIRHQKPWYYVLKQLPAGSTRFEKVGEFFGEDKQRGKAELPPGSHINEQGHIVDKIDYPFVGDPQVIGRWVSVDFVHTIDEFNPASPQWKGDLFLKELVFQNNGKMGMPWMTWTNGLVLNQGGRTASKYTIKYIDGTNYMFYEWKSGDYVIAHLRPFYYVLKKAESN